MFYAQKKSLVSFFFLTLLGVVLSFFLSSAATFASEDQAQQLADGLRDAKAKVDTIIQQAQEHISDGGMLRENDSAALPILVEASGSLFRAAENADSAKASFISGLIALGNYRFSMACMSTGISRSQVSRSRTAALMPPAGFLAPFGTDLGSIVNELRQLKFDVGCP